MELRAIQLGYKEITYKLNTILEARLERESNPEPNSKPDFEPELEVHLKEVPE